MGSFLDYRTISSFLSPCHVDVTMTSLCPWSLEILEKSPARPLIFIKMNVVYKHCDVTAVNDLVNRSSVSHPLPSLVAGASFLCVDVHVCGEPTLC